MMNPSVENRAFEEMRRAAIQCLPGRDAEKIARLSGAVLSDSGDIMKLSTLGESISIRLPSWEIETPMEPWHHLTLLHYLSNADGAPLTGEWIPFGALKDGMIRGTKFERTVETVWGKRLGTYPLSTLETSCRMLGGEVQSYSENLCAVFPFFPNYPVQLRLWLADEEFDGTAHMLVDRSADHYLTIEDAVTVGEILMQKLEQAVSQP